MIEITRKVKPAEGVAITGKLSLPWELRQKRWLRTQLLSGEEVALKLPRGESLKAGDLLATLDGGAIEVVAAPENVLHVESASSQELARAAYHLGNRHAAVQVGHGFLRIVEDTVLEKLLRSLGAKVTRIKAPFEPETGAYGGAHDHTGDEQLGGRDDGRRNPR
jgi:urease accessory protein